MAEDDSNSTLQYHLPNDNRYSIAYIDDNLERSAEQKEKLEERPDLDVVSGVVEVGENQVCHIYTMNDPDEYIRGVEGSLGLDEWVLSLTEDQAQFNQLIYDIFEGVLDKVEAKEDEFELYKRMQHKKISEIPNRVEWRQSVPAVAAELLSEFILTHPMPNSNHRTGIGLLDRYLASYSQSFTIPDTGENGSWYPWAADYIFDSKRLLTLRRKSPLLKRALECGYDRVRRKDGAEIDLHETNLDRDNYTRYFGDRHLERTHEFVDTVLSKTGSCKLNRMEDKGKRVFIARLKSSN